MRLLQTDHSRRRRTPSRRSALHAKALMTHIPQKRAVSSFDPIGNVTTQQYRLQKEVRNKTA